MLLEVDNVHAGYGGGSVLKGVSLEVDKGEWVVVLGGNGAGKSTLFKVMSGLRKVQSGRVFLEESELTTLSCSQIVNLGLIQVPEGRMIFPRMSVMENLLLGGRNRRARDHIDTNLEKVFRIFPILKTRGNQEAGTLSGGEQQMLAIGRGLMGRPRTLLLDEPSLGLSPMLVSEIFRVLVELNKEGLTILMVEQNASVSLRDSHRAYLLENGKMKMSSKSQDLMKDEETKRIYLGLSK